ncbi:MAG: hypothetical protein FWE25_03300 [Lachnospiraceae bacterium]|nr:hypothetical protein [Lachnospiraceae bacterium]
MDLLGAILDAVEEEVDDFAKRLEESMKSTIRSNSGALKDSITTEKESSTLTRVGVDAAKLQGDGRNQGGEHAKDGFDYSKAYLNGRSGGRALKPKGKRSMKWDTKYSKGSAMKVSQGAQDGHDFLAEAIEMTDM